MPLYRPASWVRGGLVLALIFGVAACPSRDSTPPEPQPIDFSQGTGCADPTSNAPNPDAGRYGLYTVTDAGFALLARDTRSNEHVSVSGAASVTPDGKFVAVNAQRHWVIEMGTGKVTRVSVTPAGEYSHDVVVTPTADAISADGRYVAFLHGGSDLIAGDRNDYGDIYVRDVTTGSTTRVSVSSTGEEANDHSRIPAISADGNTVAFLSSASNLVPGDTNGLEDIFVHDRRTRAITQITKGVRAAGPTGFGFRGVTLSGDGRSVIFSSVMKGLVPEDTDAQEDVFLHDLRSGRTVRLSEPMGGGTANGRSHEATGAVSHDGTCVAFVSAATNLVPGDPNSGLFVRDLTDGTIRRVSDDESGKPLNPGDTGVATIFSSGRAVAFVAGRSTYVRDLAAARTVRAGPSDPFSVPLEPGIRCGGVRTFDRPPAFDPRPEGYAVAAVYRSLDSQSVGVHSIVPDRATRVLDERKWMLDMVRFRSASAFTFQLSGHRVGNALCEFSFRNGRVSELLRAEQFVSYDWSPDGRALAYVGLTKDRKPRAGVFVWRSMGAPRQIADLGIWRPDGSTWMHEEDRITWSPDGRRLLVGVDNAGRRPAIRVIEASGRSLIQPRFGTLARWLPSGDVVFRDAEASNADRGAWHVMDVDGDTDRQLAIEPGTTRPAVSPDGRYLAVDDNDKAIVYLFDIEAGTQRVLVRGYLDALWVAPQVVAVMKVEPCPRLDSEGLCAEGPAWHHVGSTRTTIDIATRDIEDSAFRWSFETDLLYSTG